jgi:hypothetical protein
MNRAESTAIMKGGRHMFHSFSRILVLGLVIVALAALPTVAEAAPAPCKGDASTPLRRADLWLGALEQFAVQHPDLTADQAQFIDQAVTLAKDLAVQPEDVRVQAALQRKVKGVVELSRELFTRNQLGALYSAMGGPMQRWLTEMTAMTALCDCVGSGSCTMPNGGPTGTCQGGCLTWENGGTRYDGLCGSAAAE